LVLLAVLQEQQECKGKLQMQDVYTILQKYPETGQKLSGENIRSSTSSYKTEI
jgi:hypothetical protein